MDVGVLIFFVVILLVGGIVLFFIAARGRGSATLNVEKFRSDWLRIDQSVVRDSEASYHMAILNADKLLDSALRQRGFKGETIGERMKSAQNIWSNANHVWTAHKLRNQIAHEPNVNVSYDTTRRALAAFKQALKDTGAI